MDLQKEREAFEDWYCKNHTGLKQSDLAKFRTLSGYSFSDSLKINISWEAWQAAKAHEAEKLKGCVVVPKDKIEVWWQDAEEPENFATQLKDLHFIADGLEDGDIMKIHEHHTIHMPSNTLYGAWIYKDGERVFITGTKAEVDEAARGGNE